MGARSVYLWGLLAAYVAIAASGCGESPLRSSDATQPGDSVQSESGILRTVRDDGRDRIWTLSLNGYVQVHDAGGKTLLRQIDLPGWLAVRTRCMPDLILDKGGSAWVSSNVRPWLWRIAADTLELEVYQVTMPGREGLDIGFGALAIAADGTLRGLSPVANSIWRIEHRRGTATMIHAYQMPLQGCRIPD